MAKSDCRNCKCSVLGHFKRYGEEIYRCSHCPCQLYLPTDNLEYLEWRYDEKEKV